MVLHDGTLYVAYFHPNAATTHVIAYDARSGLERWRRGIWGAHPLGHSGYRNEVQMVWLDDRLVLYGMEHAGRYIEVLEPTTGNVLGHRPVVE
jgi:hypothetical protein